MRPPLPQQAARASAGAGGGVGLKIALGMGIGLAAVVVLGGGAFGIVRLMGRVNEKTVASVDTKQAAPEVPPKTSPETPPKIEEPKVAPVTNNGSAEPRTNPKPTKASSPPEKKENESSSAVPPPTPDPATKKSDPPAAPSPTTPAPTPSTSTPSPPPPTAPAAAPPLDDVRQRGNFLPIPESKTIDAIELAKIEVAKPADCDLAVMGTEDLLPMGQGIKLDRVDSPDKRTWTLSLKGNGALNKDRAIAEFTLAGKVLAFKWRPGAASSPLPLHYCLLQITAGGEKEICRLAKPIPLPPLKITQGETTSIEMTLPAGIGQKIQILRLEITPIDFPSVDYEANKGLKAGEGMSLKITGTASGTISPDLDLDVKFEGTGGKTTVKMSSSAAWPDAKGKNAKGKVTAALLEAKKKEASRKVTVLQKKKSILETDKAKLEKDEMILANYMPLTIFERNEQVQKQTLLAQDLANVQIALDTATTQHDTATASVQWCDDMLALLKDLDARSRLGIRIYREVGKEVIEIVTADATAAP